MLPPPPPPHDTPFPHQTPTHHPTHTNHQPTTNPTQLTSRMSDADPTSFATILSSLGRLRLRPGRPWLDAFARAMHPKLSAFAPRDFAHALSGLAKLGYTPNPEWRFDYLLETRTALPRYALPDVVVTLRALAAFAAKGLKVRAPAEWVAALLVRARVCLSAANSQSSSGSSSSGGGGGEEGSPVTNSSGSGGSSNSGRGIAVELLVSVAELRTAPGTALLAAALTRIFGVHYSPALAVAAGPSRSISSPGAAPPAATAPAAAPPAGMQKRPVPIIAASGPAPSEPAVDPAAAQWLSAHPRSVSRLLLVLSSFWRASGDECAWLRRNVRAVRALVEIAAAQLPAADPGCAVQLLQAVAALSFHPGDAWLEAHERRVLQLLPSFRPAALQGMVAWYRHLQRDPADALLEAAATAAAAAAEEQRAAQLREVQRDAQREAGREAQRWRAGVRLQQQGPGRVMLPRGLTRTQQERQEQQQERRQQLIQQQQPQQQQQQLERI